MKKENNIYQRVTELDELFFITLYGFKAYWDMGKIEDRAATRIRRAIGIDVKGYNIVLRSDDFVHFYNSHYGSQEKRRTSRGISIDDIRTLPIIVNQFTNVEIGNYADTLLFEKKLCPRTISISHNY